MDTLTLKNTFTDERLPAAPLILGSWGPDLVAAAVEGEGGSIVEARATQALYSPGRSIAVSFDAIVDWPGGSRTDEVLVAVSKRSELPGNVRVTTTGDAAAAVWRFPDDPVLPAVRSAMTETDLRPLLARMDLDPEAVEVTGLVYRPMRRAVVKLGLTEARLVFNPDRRELRVDRSERVIYLKVVRPATVARVRTIHEDLGRVLPVPRCHDVGEDTGLLPLEGMPGITLRDFLRRGSGTPPSPLELLELLDALAAVRSVEPTTRPMGARVRSHARLLKTVVPDHADRVRRLSRRLRDLAPQPLEVTHGDFHDSQLLVSDSGSITGLLDLDGVGPGERIDDLASVLGRVWTSAHGNGRGSARFTEYADELFEVFSSRVDRHELCKRVACIVFGRATGPFRTQSQNWREKTAERLELAERCLDRARLGELPS